VRVERAARFGRFVERVSELADTLGRKRALGDARERFTGPFWVAQDGDLYSLAVGTSGVARSSMFRRGPAG
jgi:hypothetical protein